MAVTAHFLIRDDDHQLSLISRLIAFKHVIVHHDGDFLARHFFPVLKEEDILDKVCPFSYALPTHCVVLSHAHIMVFKVGTISMDSATSNDTKLAGLDFLFKIETTYQFDHTRNHVLYARRAH